MKFIEPVNHIHWVESQPATDVVCQHGRGARTETRLWTAKSREIAAAACELDARDSRP
jgi:hypothetical protein